MQSEISNQNFQISDFKSEIAPSTQAALSRARQRSFRACRLAGHAHWRKRQRARENSASFHHFSRIYIRPIMCIAESLSTDHFRTQALSACFCLPIDYFDDQEPASFLIAPVFPTVFHRLTVRRLPPICVL